MAIDKIIDRASTISVTSTDISDDANTSTGAIDIPVGTTAQRPGSPTSGNIRYNTDIETTEIYNGTVWKKVSPIIPTLSSFSGNIVENSGTTITLTGTGFLSSNLQVNFTQSSDGINETITVTPTSDTAANVTLTSAIYSNMTVGNSVTITVTNSDLETSGNISGTVVALPSGGDSITTSGDYRIHTFTQNGTFTNTISSLSVEYLIVAGGAGGGGSQEGHQGGGGGAGGFRTNVSGATSGRGASAEAAMSLSATTFSVVVGPGGSGQGPGSAGSDGSDSSFNSIVSIGGGGGGNGQNSGSSRQGRSGGAGGGTASSDQALLAGGSGTTGQGYDGGQPTAIGNGRSGEGGGAGAEGADAPGTTGVDVSAGGTGQSSSITGSPVTYATGGGVQGVTAGSNGGTNVVHATANTGNGGIGGYSGGNTSTGRNGGSGIVIVRYDTTAL